MCARQCVSVCVSVCPRVCVREWKCECVRVRSRQNVSFVQDPSYLLPSQCTLPASCLPRISVLTLALGPPTGLPPSAQGDLRLEKLSLPAPDLDRSPWVSHLHRLSRRPVLLSPTGLVRGSGSSPEPYLPPPPEGSSGRRVPRGRSSRFRSRRAGTAPCLR